MTAQVRKAVSGDEGIILRFINALAEYEKLAHDVVADEDSIKQSLFCAQPKVFALIAEEVLGDRANPIGFALYFYSFSTFLGRHGIYLEDLFVDEERRGEGAGKMLLSTLAAIAHEEGCGRLEWSVLDWNAPSIAFYKSLGAEPMEGWTVYRLTGDALTDLARTAT